MSKDNVEKYDGEKDLDQGAVVAVLPPDDWVSHGLPISEDRRLTSEQPRGEKDLGMETGDEAQVKE